MRLGKLTMPEGLVDQLESEGFVSLSITAAHAELAPALPPTIATHSTGCWSLRRNSKRWSS